MGNITKTTQGGSVCFGGGHPLRHELVFEEVQVGGDARSKSGERLAAGLMRSRARRSIERVKSASRVCGPMWSHVFR